LAKKITEVGKGVSPSVLKNFVLPLANHNLLDEEKLGKNNNELIDSSIEVSGYFDTEFQTVLIYSVGIDSEFLLYI
jgi:hypothetical protein